MVRLLLLMTFVALLAGCNFMAQDGVEYQLTIEPAERKPIVGKEYILLPLSYPENMYKIGIRDSCMYRKTRYWLAEGAGELAEDIAAAKCQDYYKKIYKMYGDFELDEALRSVTASQPVPWPWGFRWHRERD